MKSKCKVIKIIFWIIVFVSSGYPQTSEDEARFDLKSLILPVEADTSLKTTAEIWQNIRDNPELFLSVVRKDISLPTDINFLCIKDSTLYYQLLFDILFVLDTPETKALRLIKFREFIGQLQPIEALNDSIPDYLTVEEFRKLSDAFSILIDIYNNIINAYAETNDNSIIEDCLERLRQNDRGSVGFTIMKYLEKVASGNKAVIAELKNIYNDTSSFWYKNPIFRIHMYHIEGLFSVHAVFVDSKNNRINSGNMYFFENTWKEAENNGDGTYSVYTKLDKVTIRMKYNYGNYQISNVPVKFDSILIKTIRTNVLLKDSKYSTVDSGIVMYYADGWHDLGEISGGAARKELLPGNYKFRMTYSHASAEKYQDIGIDSTVVFQTIQVVVNLIDSRSAVLDNGIVQYYSGGWWDFGTTSDGTVSKELLPYNYKFRMTYARASNEKYQDIGSNPVVLFQTVPVNVKLANNQSVLMDTGKVQYYSGGWWDFGTTTDGVVSKELLPYNYKFRMNYAKASNEKYQDVGVNPEVLFQTVNTRVGLKDSQGNALDTGEVKYYSGGWWGMGTTSNGVVSKELLPYNYKFRVTFAKASNEKYQDIGSDPDVVFRTVQTRVELRNSQAALMDPGLVKYYSGGWWDFGTTSNGIVSKELLPYNYKFRMTYANGSNEKYQDTGVNPVVLFPAVFAVVRVFNLQGNPVNNADVKYYSGGWYPFGVTSGGTVVRELLPNNYKFRATAGSKTSEKYQDLSMNPVVILTLDVP